MRTQIHGKQRPSRSLVFIRHGRARLRDHLRPRFLEELARRFQLTPPVIGDLHILHAGHRFTVACIWFAFQSLPTERIEMQTMWTDKRAVNNISPLNTH